MVPKHAKSVAIKKAMLLNTDEIVASLTFHLKTSHLQSFYLRGYVVHGCGVCLIFCVECVLWWSVHNLWSLMATYVISQKIVYEMAVN